MDNLIVRGNKEKVIIDYYQDIITIDTEKVAIYVNGKNILSSNKDIVKIEYDFQDNNVIYTGENKGRRFIGTYSLDSIIFKAYSELFSVVFNEDNNESELFINNNGELLSLHKGENVEGFGKYKGEIYSKIYFDDSNKDEILCINGIERRQVLNYIKIEVNGKDIIAKVRSNELKDVIISYSLENLLEKYNIK